MGSWHPAQGRHSPEVEIDALRTRLDLGMTLVDTTELYGDGASERLDLYLLHWRGAVPLEAAVETDQVLYNLMRRGIEWNLLPWCQRQGLATLAYSPMRHKAPRPRSRWPG